jgi:dolichyl-diphosphooligosaccharide--protein glycosyltransferase
MSKRSSLILLLGLVLGVNLYFRSFPIYFPQLKSQAINMVEKAIEQDISRDIYSKFSNFNPQAIDRIVKERIPEYKKQNKKLIEGQIHNLYLQLKDRFQDEGGQTYLMELDCWHWARYVENVVRFGRPGDEAAGGKQRDALMLAPQGSALIWEHFLYYFSASLYNFFSIFKKSISLFDFLFYLPLFFSAVFIIALYLFSSYFGGHISGVVSCLFVGLSPIFLPRSCAGWFDKDILNLLFPLLVTWAYLLSYRNMSFRYRLLWIFFSSFWVGLFCFTWSFWWFIFIIIIIYECAALSYLVFERFYLKRENAGFIKQHAASLFSFLIFSFFWIILFSGTEPFVALYNQIKQALTLNKPLIGSIWPNVFYTVGELKKTDIREMAEYAGGKAVFVFSLLCICTLLKRALRNRPYAYSKCAGIIIMAIWFIAMFFASLRGVRFVIFALLPLGVCLGWAAHELYEYFRGKKITLGAYFILLLLVIFCSTITRKGLRAAEGIYPLMDDNWYKVLNIIKEKTPPQAIINSWWDFGDWFKVVARRRVIFDGQSQDRPQAYWMAKVLLSQSEDEAVSILRMLNNGGNKAFEIINEHLNNPLESVLLLENVISLTPERAQQVLSKYLPVSIAESVMKILFSKSQTACFIVENSMIPKMAAISYLGNWDFSKVYIAQNFNNKEKDTIIEYLKNTGKDIQQMQKFYQEAFVITARNLDEWLSYRLQFYSSLVNGHEKNGFIFFDNGFMYNLTEKVIQSNSGQIPVSLFALLDNKFTEIRYPNANVPFSILVLKEKETYKCILLDRQLAGSMFVRLYFFNGAGLAHFIPFIDAQEGNNYIRIFNILW